MEEKSNKFYKRITDQVNKMIPEEWEEAKVYPDLIALVQKNDFYPVAADNDKVR
ncbi:DUF600 family protein [Alkalihalophilus marmarensis]|jgi:hypothetical protein|uniref:immunity protein YezG family protein n=1 Tax=Alkalihalophilus marmarensis TaxID=521377 RepID=UPI00204095BC|nr:immunity protein YezG family protein [Alkalihalophilus marmarensis]MCM3491188.1 DUF600 family protein [Alkalihalophilus marmarensis]